MMTRIGRRSAQMLAFIEEEVEQTGVPPSYARISRALHFGSIAEVARIVKRLERAGAIKRRSGHWRRANGWHKPVIAQVKRRLSPAPIET